MKIARSVLKEISKISLPNIAVALFILIPTSFLLILYVKTASQSE